MEYLTVNMNAMATSACDSDRVSSLLASLYSSYHRSPNNEQTRLAMLETARTLVQCLETPRETVLRLCWAEPTLYGAIITAISIGIFRHMNRCPELPMTAANLAELTGAASGLISRIMKHLSAMGVVRECGPDEYFSTRLSRTLASAKYADGFLCMAKGAMRSIYRLPEYFKKNGYKNPNDPNKGPFQFAYNTSKHWFVWASQNPPVVQQFNNHMSAYHQGRPSWMDNDFFPVQAALIKDAHLSPEAVLLVDVGGGLGHDLAEFARKHPTAPGRLVLQDKRDVISQFDDEVGDIEPMVHNFFTRQPIEGARAYYLHSVLHDWPDDECHRILTCIAAAMEPGYSKLLVNENIVPEQQAGWQITGLDLMLMSLTSSRERRENEWRQLLHRAGFRILGVWSHVNGVESLIECELA